MKLNELTIKQAAGRLAKGEITSLQLTEACLERISAVNGKLNACLLVCREEALADARAADERLAAGERTPLLGIPFLVKDNILTKGLRTTAASKMLENYVAPYDATVVAKLKQAGAVLLGKTNLDEFAHGASTEFSYFGPTKNPYDLERVPGGSSGGSAAAVAADMCLFALGTDTGGSIRHPASFCGVVGFKPTYGACSRFGLIAMTSSTDVPGPLTKTAADAAIVWQVMAGFDERDSTTLKIQNSKFKISRATDIAFLELTDNKLQTTHNKLKPVTDNQQTLSSNQYPVTSIQYILFASICAFILHGMFEAWWVGAGSFELPVFMVYIGLILPLRALR